MQSTPRNLALLTLAAVLISTGCKKPVATDDASVTAAVQTRLASDTALGSEPIQSSVQGGVATLSGTVGSDAARVLAGNDAAQVPGVRTVMNNLTVQNNANVAAQGLPSEQGLAPAPAPEVSVNTAPTHVRTLPAKPTAQVERGRIATQPAPAPLPATVERPTPQPAAPQQPAAPPQPTFRNVNLPAGTSIPVRITQTLDSGTTQEGSTFSGTVASDVLADGVVAIPQGSPVTGRVDVVQEAAHFKGNSLLTIEITSISHAGNRIPVSTEAFTKEGASRGRNTAVKTGAGAAAGAILGGIFGGGKGAAIGAVAGGGTGAGINAVTRGQQVQIPSESLVPFRLSNSVSVRVSSRDDVRARTQGNQPDQNNLPDATLPADDPNRPNLHRRPQN